MKNRNTKPAPAGHVDRLSPAALRRERSPSAVIHGHEQWIEQTGNPPPKYSVHAFRDAGLQAEWTRTAKGAPIIIARDPAGRLPHQRTKWWYVGDAMWETMNDPAVGIRRGFEQHTLLGDVFFI